MMQTYHQIARGDVLLAVDHVSLSFGGVKAITEVSFDIRKGEIRAIIGPNGAGKTSMLNVINGFYHPQKGKITFKGLTRSRMRPSAWRTFSCAERSSSCERWAFSCTLCVSRMTSAITLSSSLMSLAALIRSA